jgi:hypothetical protein
MIERFDDFKMSGWRWRWAHHLAWDLWRNRTTRTLHEPKDDDDLHGSLLIEVTQASWTPREKVSRLPRARLAKR